MSATNAEDNKTKQYLTFTLRDADFAVDIGKVREVLDVTTLTKIPKMPEFISGVINLRGNVVPVMDLGHRLGMEPVDFLKNTCVMIVETKIEGATVAMGTIADSVQMVVDLHADEIEALPHMGASINTDFINGMGRQGEKFLILLNIDKVLSNQDTGDLAGMDLGSILNMEAKNMAVEGVQAMA